MINMAQELLTIQEVANKLKVSKYTVLRFIHKGKLEAVRVGGGYRVGSEALEQYIANNRTQRGS